MIGMKCSDGDEDETVNTGRLLSENALGNVVAFDGHDIEVGEGHPRPLGKVTCRHNLDDPVIWRWFVVAGMFVTAFFHGVERTMSLYYVELMDYFETDSSVMSLIGSVYYTCQLFSGLVIMPLTEKYGPRVIIMLGGILIFVGLMTSAFAPNVYVCIATFGVFVGCGSCMTFMNATTVIMFYFKKHRALAQGIGISGSSVGGIVLPIIVQYLNEHYTWRGGLLVLAAMTLNVCVSGALVRPIKASKARSRDFLPDNDDRNRGMCHSLKKLLHSRPFIFLCIQSIFMQICESNLTIYMKAMTLEKTEVGDDFGSYVVSFYAVAHFVGMLTSGFVTQLTEIEPFILFQIYLFFGACGISLIPASKSFLAMVCFICSFAHFSASTVIIMPLALYNLVGEHAVRLAWAIRFASCGIGGFAGPAIAGVLYDYTKDYYYPMYLCGTGLFLSILLMIEPCVSLMRAKKAGVKVEIEMED